MLDKIKVYNRDGARLQDVYNINFVNEEIRLQVNDVVGSVFTLTKTDPLNKFKKEIEGWWFCEEYVVIEMYSYTFSTSKRYAGDSLGWFSDEHKFINIEIVYYANNPAIHYIKSRQNSVYASINYNELQSIEHGWDATLNLNIYSQNEVKNMVNDYYAKRKNPPLAVKNDIFYKILEIINPYFDYNNEVKKKCGNKKTEIKIDYSIGEDKYLELLELIK